MRGYGCIYIKDGKILINKQDGVPLYTVPLKLDSENFIDFLTMIANEYQIQAHIEKFLLLNTKQFIRNDKYLDVDTYFYHIKDFPAYDFQIKYQLKESGEYTDKKYISLQEAKEMYKNGQLSEDTMRIISNYSEEIGLK